MDDPLRPPVDGEPAKRLARRSALKLLGLALTGAAATPSLAPAPAAAQAPPPPSPAAASGRSGRAWALRPLATGTSPRWFEPASFAALGAVVGLILPDTDTPGARTAGVHWYLDEVAAVDGTLGERLRQGLERLNARAAAVHGRSFAELNEAQQTALLTPYAHQATGTVTLDAAAQPRVTGASAQTDAVTPDDRSFFAVIKAQTIDAYYKSEMGQIGELEWVGHEFHDTFPGACAHADALTHPRPQWPTRRS